ncbi:hypothetical protein NDU88_002801 [Pleurodeles waltl]|uniref:Uncharacterized protein n=1 Tax=Pleurodeles waltl TaxID=8319 RepID=A0AAV7NGG2_PLEWA|nr:hypothetical protein NDU88_002801 [Pleurodeles waltl]
MVERFRVRGYPRKVQEDAKEKVKLKTGDELLFPMTKETEGPNQIRLIITVKGSARSPPRRLQDKSRFRVPMLPWERFHCEAGVRRLPRQPPMTMTPRIGRREAKCREISQREEEQGERRTAAATAGEAESGKRAERNPGKERRKAAAAVGKGSHTILTATSWMEGSPSGQNPTETTPGGTELHRNPRGPDQTTTGQETNERTSTEPATAPEGRGSGSCTRKAELPAASNHHTSILPSPVPGLAGNDPNRAAEPLGHKQNRTTGVRTAQDGQMDRAARRTRQQKWRCWRNEVDEPETLAGGAGLIQLSRRGALLADRWGRDWGLHPKPLGPEV